MYSLRWRHNAEPPDFDLMLVQDRPVGWVNASLTLLGELRHRAPHAIDWGPAVRRGRRARRRVGIELRWTTRTVNSSA